MKSSQIRIHSTIYIYKHITIPIIIKGDSEGKTHIQYMHVHIHTYIVQSVAEGDVLE